MPILADYHLHSYYSADSEAPMETQVQAALAKGLLAICFTEHVDLDWPYENTPVEERAGRPFTIDYEAYREEFLRLKEKYRGKIALHFGLELGLNVAYKGAICDYLKEHPDFEFIIGSTHSSRHQDPYEPSFFEGISVEEALRQYFADALNNIRQMPWFDSYGHLDYPIRYAAKRYSEEEMQALLTQKKDVPAYSYSDLVYEENKAVIDEILKELIDHSIALEVNTQALAKGFPWTNPGRAILTRYHALGGRMISVGADAHQPKGVGYGFDAAAKELAECGFDSYVTFEKRQPVWHTL